VADGEESLVLFAPPHRLSIDTTASAASVQAATASDACGSATPTGTSGPPTGTSGSSCHNFLPLRLQCRFLQLGEGMASGQEGLLLPDSEQGVLTGPAASTSCNDIFALRLQCGLPRLLPLFIETVVGGKAGLVLPAHAAWLSNNSRSSLRSCELMCSRGAKMHGGVTARK